MAYKDEVYKGYTIIYHKDQDKVIHSRVIGMGSKICSGSNKADVSKNTKRLIDMYSKTSKALRANRR